MPNPLIPSHPPTGIAFELPDLIMLRGWANQHRIHMQIELDNCVDGEEYEEILAFKTQCSILYRWIMWRTVHGVTVQPLIGKPRFFTSVADAMEAMTLVVS